MDKLWLPRLNCFGATNTFYIVAMYPDGRDATHEFVRMAFHSPDKTWYNNLKEHAYGNENYELLTIMRELENGKL